MSEKSKVSYDDRINSKVVELVALIKEGTDSKEECNTHAIIATGLNQGEHGLSGGLTNGFIGGSQLSFIQMLLGLADTNIEVAKVVARAGYILTNNVKEVHTFIQEMVREDLKAANVDDAEVVDAEVVEAKPKKTTKKK